MKSFLFTALLAPCLLYWQNPEYSRSCFTRNFWRQLGKLFPIGLKRIEKILSGAKFMVKISEAKFNSVGKKYYADLISTRRHLKINERPLVRCIKRFKRGRNFELKYKEQRSIPPMIRKLDCTDLFQTQRYMKINTQPHLRMLERSKFRVQM